MMLVATKVFLRWDAVSGASGYEIVINEAGTQKPKAQAGKLARTTTVSVTQGKKTIVTVNDLPKRQSPQVFEFVGQVV